MSVDDVTGVLRTAYRPFAYCVLSKKLKTAYQMGLGVIFITNTSKHGFIKHRKYSRTTKYNH